MVAYNYSLEKFSIIEYSIIDFDFNRNNSNNYLK